MGASGLNKGRGGANKGLMLIGVQSALNADAT